MILSGVIRDLQEQINSMRSLLGIPSRDLKELDRKVTDHETRIRALENETHGEMPDAWFERLDNSVKRVERLVQQSQ